MTYQHINPCSLLKFWRTKNNKIRAFNKVSLKLLPSMSIHKVCGQNNFISQELENQFANYLDNKIGCVIQEIILTGKISSYNKLMISEFQAHQIKRNLFMHQIIKISLDNFKMSNFHQTIGFQCIDDMVEYINTKASNDIADQMIEKHMNMRWQLLIVEKPSFITNEAIETIDFIDNNYKTRFIYFPISPTHCIAISDEEVKIHIDDKLILHINNTIARMPGTKWIIFNKNYNPMQDITLYENGQIIYSNGMAFR